MTGGRLLLALAAVAVAFAAADTYVVVMALPDMMAGVGLSIQELQRGAPIVSGFLLGYVAMLPLIGRIADLRGRVPVLAAGLIIFAAGSLITALAYDLPSMVTGRFFQGLGGGALVPATLALVADLYPVDRRGVPLGVVSAVQELGSVLGPLFGAAVLAVADWRAIFAVNLVVGLVLFAALRAVSRGSVVSAAAPGAPGSPGRFRGVSVLYTPPTTPPTPPWRRRPDLIGLLLLLVTLTATALVFVRPPALVRDLTWGELYVPLVGDGRWLTIIGLIAIGGALAFLVRSWFARRPLLDLRGWAAIARRVDLLGALLLAVVLGGIVLAFATADPAVQLFSPQGRWYLLAAGVAAVAFGIHLRRTSDPIVPPAALRRRPAWGSIVVSFLVGVSLVAALIDIPLFAHTTTYSGDEFGAALVLVRFLIALPVGAVAGGYATRYLTAGVVAAVGLVLAAIAFLLMAQWDVDALTRASATIPLVLGGLGFGLALAPVNAALLACTDAADHGLASSLVVVARMVGMLVGISGLTAIGLRRYYAEQEDLPGLTEICGSGGGMCAEYTELLQGAAITQEHTVFLGAAVAAVTGAVLSVILLRGAPTRSG